MIVLVYISLFFFIFGVLLFFFLFFLPKDTLILEKNIKKNPRFAVLIPARDESFVIEGILKSIDCQTRKIFFQDVYVIVEDSNDPTVLICQKYGACVIVRKHLDKKSKGYALDEAISFLKKEKKFYDAYFIFDADNMLDKNYFKEMEKDYLKGYAISTGYRGYKNAWESIVACASGVIYTFINEWINKHNMRKNKSLMLSGTGFYIHGDYIKLWGEYPFHSLCEDVELSYYATRKGLSMHYNDKALFYDEQPTKMSVSIMQRKRWVKGYFENWFLNIKVLWTTFRIRTQNCSSILDMLFGITPIIFIVLSILIFVIYLMLRVRFLSLFLLLFFIYLFLFLGTYFILKKDDNKLKLSKKMKFQASLYHPIFLITYLYVVILALFQKNMTWDKVPHGECRKQ